jgi:holliday junction DNA helicase RuvB
MTKKHLENGPVSRSSEQFLDSTLRPLSWDDYIGQETIKNNVKILLTAANERGHPPEHMLFYGAPGLGKTTIAHLIAKELSAQIKVTSGPAIERVGDLASILTNLAPRDVLFIDEAHRMNKMVEEVLYPAMESGVLHIIIGKGPGARTIQLDISPFTLIAATTRIALLSGPLRSRFSGGTFRLSLYKEDDIKKIVARSADMLGVNIHDDAIDEIACRSRCVPRTANHLLKRVRDFAQVKKKPLDKETALDAFQILGVDNLGLSSGDLKIIETIVTKFSGGPVGLSTIATALGEEESTVEEVYEPYLIQLGFIGKTPRGRVATKAAFEHLGITPPKDLQNKLL